MSPRARSLLAQTVTVIVLSWAVILVLAAPDLTGVQERADEVTARLAKEWRGE
jgi:hypothetical protein